MATDVFFRTRLDPRHPLAVLADRMPWDRINAALATAFARQERPSRALADTELFGPTLEIAGTGTSAADRPLSQCHWRSRCGRTTEGNDRCGDLKAVSNAGWLA